MLVKDQRKIKERIIMRKRELGEGRWDKILKRKLLELSVSDNYDEAKEEWIATGNVWWKGNGQAPEWVSNTEHMNYCLCGHGIVYHFHIKNTENGNEECVGSDHINSYLIMRHIAKELKLEVDAITEEQIEQWIKVRVGSMKAEAWWARHGERFEKRFNFIKEYDLRYNTRTVGWNYDSSIEKQVPILKIRKKGKGEYGEPNYQMASVVWRWNHPDNPKNQQTVHGFPNEKLLDDILLLYRGHRDKIERLNQVREELEVRRQEIAERKAREAEEARQRMLARQAERERIQQAQQEAEAERERVYNLPENVRERQEREVERIKLQALKREQQRVSQEAYLAEQNITFENMCEYYGIPAFDDSWAGSSWTRNFLGDIKKRLSEQRELSPRQIESLKDILLSKPTQKQLNYLESLGYDGEEPKTKTIASKLINQLKND